MLTVMGLAAASLTGAGIAAAQTPAPAIKLVAPSTNVAVERYNEDPIYLYDIGLYAVAAQQRFEIRTHRASYKDPIVATLTLGEGSTAQKKTLPTGLVTKADSLTKVFSMTVKNSAGAVVFNGDMGWCPNDYEAARAVPTGAASNPYPYQCGDHPFAIGGVFGIQRGWSVQALNSWYDTPQFQGPDGAYTISLAMKKPWRDALGVTAAQTTASVIADVTTYTDSELGRTPAAPVAAQAAVSPLGQHAGHVHSASAAATAALAPKAGAVVTQREQLEAARVAALGRANQPSSKAPLAPKSAAGVQAAEAAKKAVPKPDLRSLPAYQIGLDRTDGEGNPVDNTYLQFGATVWNAGPSPLVVDGFRRTGTGLMDAYQYFYDAAGKEVGSANAGTLQWDPRPGHHHWHFTAFATYQLLDSTKKLTVRSGKEAFCLAPTDSIDLTVKGAQWRPGSTDLGTACGSEGALSIREVLDTGWGDTYGQYLPGQSFDVTDLTNGIYYIQVLANPDQKLAESDTTNNSALRKVKLGGTVGGERTIKVYPYEGIDAP